MATETTNEAAAMMNEGLWIPFPNLCVLTLPVWGERHADAAAERVKERI